MFFALINPDSTIPKPACIINTRKAVAAIEAAGDVSVIQTDTNTFEISISNVVWGGDTGTGRYWDLYRAVNVDGTRPLDTTFSLDSVSSGISYFFLNRIF